MRAWLQSEWQRLGGGALVLLPFSVLFALAARLRRVLYRARILPSWRAPVPVVVVGNISAGGTGKTPLAIAILDLLSRHGWNPGVVARGYGRVPRREHEPLGVVAVYPDVATPEHFGDEPVLIARRLVDGERRFGNGLPLPSGPLREPLSRLREVDAVVVNGGAPIEAPCRRQFAMQLGGERFVALSGNRTYTPEEFALAARGRPVAAVAGTGNPQRFFEHLARLGIEARGIAFPDHHAFDARDLRLPGAEVVVMTEKDAVKCAAFADARMWFMRVEAILPADFDDFLLARLAQSRSADGSQAA